MRLARVPILNVFDAKDSSDQPLGFEVMDGGMYASGVWRDDYRPEAKKAIAVALILNEDERINLEIRRCCPIVCCCATCLHEA